MISPRRCRAPSFRQSNEYFENETLSRKMEGLPAQDGFVRAVRDYAEAEPNRQVRIIESVIRTSRGLTDNHRPLPRDVQETLLLIIRRYEPFSPTKIASTPRTFAEARQVLRTLFF